MMVLQGSIEMASQARANYVVFHARSNNHDHRHGRPWVMTVDSRATTGWDRANAAATWGAMVSGFEDRLIQQLP